MFTRNPLPHRILAGWVFLLAGGAATSAQTVTSPPAVEIIVARMAQARVDNQAGFRPYNVTRDYQLFGKEKLKTKSQIIVNIAFVPPDHKKYSIQRATGTGVGETIVRRMLESETEITKDDTSADISPDNYVFRFLREEEVDTRPCYVLGLTPRRKDKNLLRGSIWVDARTYLLRRTEGEPAKSLSWWARDIRIALLYGDVQGMWLQTAMEATANVRLLGRHTIVSRDVAYEISGPTAAQAVAVIAAEEVLTAPSASGPTPKR